MLHPSYSEIMKVVNSEVEQGESPVVGSRYSIVLATAKRARQIIARQTKNKDNMDMIQISKPLSRAVSELYEGKMKILPETEEEQEQEFSVSEESIMEDALLTEEEQKELEESETPDDGAQDAEEVTEE